MRGVWKGFLLGKVRGQDVPCRFCGSRDSDGHLFWECTFPPLVEIREHPELHDLIEMDKTSWPRCLLWHGWLPLLSGINGNSPWSQTPAEGAVYICLNVLLGGILLVSLLSGSYLLVLMLMVLLKGLQGDPDVWTDGSLVDEKDSGVSSAGAGCFTFRVRRLWDCWNWSH